MKNASKTNRCQSNHQVPAGFCRKLVSALGELKERIQSKYEHALPGRSQTVREVISEAETLAWETPFPHLFLPDFAEARFAEVLALGQPAFARAA